MKYHAILTPEEEREYGMQLQAVHEGIAILEESLERFPEEIQERIASELRAVIGGRNAYKSSLTHTLTYGEERERLRGLHMHGEKARKSLVALLLHPPCSDIISEEKNLALAVQALADQQRERAAFDTLVQKNIAFAKSHTKMFAKSSDNFDDLLAEAMIGLMRAACDFDPRKGRFTTHAYDWVRQFLQNFKERDTTIRIADHALQSSKHADEEQNEQPTKQERLPVAFQASSEEGFGIDTIAQKNGDRLDHQTMLHEELQKAVRHMQSLSEVHRTVLRLRFGFEGEAMTLEEIGNFLGYTRERIRQLEEEALALLFQRLATEEEQEISRHTYLREEEKKLDAGTIPTRAALCRRFNQTAEQLAVSIAKLLPRDAYALLRYYSFDTSTPIGLRKTADRMGWSTQEQQRADELIARAVRTMFLAWLKQKDPSVQWTLEEVVYRFSDIVETLPEGQCYLLQTKYGRGIHNAHQQEKVLSNDNAQYLQENRAMRNIAEVVIGRALGEDTVGITRMSEECFAFLDMLSERELQALTLYAAPFHEGPKRMPAAVIINAIRQLEGVLERNEKTPRSPREAVLAQHMHFSKLHQTEREVLAARYGAESEPLSLNETAKKFGYKSTGKVVMEELRALKKLFALQVTQESKMIHLSPSAALGQVSYLLDVLDPVERMIIERVHAAALLGKGDKENRSFTAIGAELGLKNDAVMKTELRAFNKLFFALNGVLSGEKLRRTTSKQRSNIPDHRTSSGGMP